MDKQLVKKISTVSFMSAAIVSWLAVSVLLKAFAGSFGVVQRLYGNEFVSHGVPVLVGIAVFAFLQFNSRALALTEEVILEVSKVVWPSRKDVVGMTIVVIIMVMIASLILSGVDFIAREVVRILVDLPTRFG